MAIYQAELASQTSCACVMMGKCCSYSVFMPKKSVKNLCTSPYLPKPTRHYAKAANRSIYLAWGLSVLSTLLLITQSWLIAKIIAHWLTQSTTQSFTAEVFLQKFTLAYCLFITTPLTAFFQRPSRLNAGLKSTHALRMAVMEKLAQVGAARYQFGSDGSLTNSVIEQCDTLTGYEPSLFAASDRGDHAVIAIDRCCYAS